MFYQMTMAKQILAKDCHDERGNSAQGFSHFKEEK